MSFFTIAYWGWSFRPEALLPVMAAVNVYNTNIFNGELSFKDEICYLTYTNVLSDPGGPPTIYLHSCIHVLNSGFLTKLHNMDSEQKRLHQQWGSDELWPLGELQLGNKYMYTVGLNWIIASAQFKNPKLSLRLQTFITVMAFIFSMIWTSYPVPPL